MSRLTLFVRRGLKRRSVKSTSGAITPESQEKSLRRPSLTTMSSTYEETMSSSPSFYSRPVEVIRKEEYPHMSSGTYLDHSGTTLYARSTITRFAHKMQSLLLGNPHSANAPAALSSSIIATVRADALRFLGADPAHFDLVFVANATAGIKLVADAFRDLAEQTPTKTFWYGYHGEAHTSLVGVRELASRGRCFRDDGEVDAWLAEAPQAGLGLFAYPGQSNLTGRRLPLGWTKKIRGVRDVYSLFDAAALAMTSPLADVFADPAAAPDFTCVSFYKIFGFPDLGALVVRKASGHILALRKYFGGGTVSLVSTISGAWHMSKGLEAAPPDEDGHGGRLHEGLEDGTLPFHSILALGEAMGVHAELFGSMGNVSRHTTLLARRLYEGVCGLRYDNGQLLCKMYSEREGYGDPARQGATIAFNVFRRDGTYESYAAVEKAANERGIYVRSGGICCPGGVYSALQYEPWHLTRARSAGHHCGSNGLSVINELPTGVVRASLGAMSTAQDVDSLVSFLQRSFIERERHALTPVVDIQAEISMEHVQSVPIYSTG
ncbi:pyridoxal phosphate-dependent transferase [Lasiosphaeria hispida]|uniref:Pyridoxal phosphate-dependent transferase n=1 Tax=Lasiosphaeria hispida TaxID=260671 RepID=A0AAJ0H6J9_9PEZI|nr:pyridoxal phosphate-dependent transferase [Lasiosphaeria hispida]